MNIYFSSTYEIQKEWDMNRKKASNMKQFTSTLVSESCSLSSTHHFFWRRKKNWVIIYYGRECIEIRERKVKRIGNFAKVSKDYETKSSLLIIINQLIMSIHGRNQEGLDPLQKILSRALAAVQIFSEGFQTLLGTHMSQSNSKKFFKKYLKFK